MLLSLLIFSGILITVGFQTASAIVMALVDPLLQLDADGLIIKFYINRTDNTLGWIDRDVSMALHLTPFNRNPSCELRVFCADRALKHDLDDHYHALLVSTEGYFEIRESNVKYYRYGRRKASRRKWAEIADGLYLYQPARLRFRTKGWVRYEPPETLNETGTVTVIGEIEEVVVRIRYTANQEDENDKDFALATVEGREVLFYPDPDGRLRLIYTPPVVSDPHMIGFEILN
jgi:hypothetical protein